MARQQGSVIADDEELETEEPFEEDETEEEEDLEDSDVEDEEEDDSEEDDADETEPVVRGKQRTNWETRFKGLQKTVQQKAEEAQAWRNQAMLAEAQAFQAQIQPLPPEQQQALQQLFMADMASKYRLSQAQELEQRAQEAARQLYIREKAEEFGVPVKFLAKFDTPEEIDHAAKSMAAQQKRSQKTTKKQVKTAAGTKPKFGSGGTGATAKKEKAKSLDDAASRLAKYNIGE